MVRDPESLRPKGRSEWRAWLEKNHARQKGIWLFVAKKGAAKKGVKYEEAVEEALCFGWIDSTVNSYDESFFKQWYSPRKKGSIWSRNNKERVARLIESGKMAPPGLAKIKAAKKDGSWDSLETIESLSHPDDLILALESNKPAKKNFELYNVSTKKMLLRWIDSAKRPETRRKRIEEIIKMAENGESLAEYLRKK